MAQRLQRYDPTWMLTIALVFSAAIHVMYVLSLHPSQTRKEANRPIEIEMIQVEPPKPPPPPEPEVEQPKPAPRPPPKVKVAEPKPIVEEPPPPTQEAPKEVKPPIFIGMQMNSMTTTGTFTAPAGNSSMGRVEAKAPNPNDVKDYKAARYVPAGGADSDPLVENEVKIPYPDEAKRAGIEGDVRLRVAVDFTGKVVDIQIINGPGYGLNEAARDAVRRFKFKPAMKGGEAVTTIITYTYKFLLD